MAEAISTERKETDFEATKTGKVLAKEKKFNTRIPIDKQNPKDDVVPVQINGYVYKIKRGEDIEIPESVYNILKQAKYI